MAENCLSTNILSALKEVIQNEFNLPNYDMRILPGAAKGDNYLGICHRVVIKSFNHQNDKSEFQVFVKIPDMDPAKRVQFSTRICFLREILMYTEILPLFREIQVKAGINLETEGFNQVTKVYKCIPTENDEALLMEDLRVQGFIMSNRAKDLTLKQVLLSFEALAKLHAVSFVAKADENNVLLKVDEFQDIFLVNKDSSQAHGFVKAMLEKAMTALDAEKDEKVYGKIKALFTRSYHEVYEKVVDKAGAGQYAIVCHGDFWRNNILFKYDEMVSWILFVKL